MASKCKPSKVKILNKPIAIHKDRIEGYSKNGRTIERVPRCLNPNY